MTISRYRGKIRTLYLFFAFVLPRTSLLESKTLLSDFKIAVPHESESKNSQETKFATKPVGLNDCQCRCKLDCQQKQL